MAIMPIVEKLYMAIMPIANREKGIAKGKRYQEKGRRREEVLPL